MPALFDFSIVVLACICNGFLGFFTYSKNPKSSTNRLFFLFTLYLAIYNFANFLALHQSSDIQTLFWIRTVISIAYAINLSFFLLATVFPENKMSLKPLYFRLSVLLTIILIPLNYTPFVFSRVDHLTTQPIPGPGISLLLIHTLVFLGSGFVILVSKFRKSVGIQKTQLKLLLFGTILMFLSIVLTNLLFVIILKTTSLVGLLPIYTLIFVGFVSYAIIRHRFMDISLLVARTVSYSIFVGLTGILYIVFITLLSSFITKSPENARFIASASIILAVLMTVTFQLSRRILEKTTDKVFYRDHYDLNQLLYSVTHIMASTLSLEQLTHSLLQHVLSNLRINHGAFILTDKGNMYQIAHEGYSHAPEFDDKHIQTLLKQHQMAIFDELTEGDLKNAMRESGIKVSIRLQAEDKEIGLLVLGDKLSGDIFVTEDISFLEIFAPEVAVAIENAKSYEEIRRFNLTLKEEVNNATKDLQNANSRLKEVDKLKDEFVSLASHELRTPMTAIKSYLWLFLESKDLNLQDKQKTYIERAYQATDRLITLVNDMLNVSRIESGRLDIMVTPFDMKQLVKEVIEELSPTAMKQKINLMFVSNTEDFPQVLADENKIREVLINLIGNSLKFTYSGGSVSIKLSLDKDKLITKVIDTGKGIKKDDLEKLFQKFGTVGNNYLQKQNSQGTGLGLYISKSIVNLHGGEIWVESDGEGKGTTFSFTLKTNK